MRLNLLFEQPQPQQPPAVDNLLSDFRETPKPPANGQYYQGGADWPAVDVKQGDSVRYSKTGTVELARSSKSGTGISFKVSGEPNWVNTGRNEVQKVSGGGQQGQAQQGQAQQGQAQQAAPQQAAPQQAAPQQAAPQQAAPQQAAPQQAAPQPTAPQRQAQQAAAQQFKSGDRVTVDTSGKWKPGTPPHPETSVVADVVDVRNSTSTPGTFTYKLVTKSYPDGRWVPSRFISGKAQQSQEDEQFHRDSQNRMNMSDDDKAFWNKRRNYRSPGHYDRGGTAGR